jgi:hypothetical protein
LNKEQEKRTINIGTAIEIFDRLAVRSAMGIFWWLLDPSKIVDPFPSLTIPAPALGLSSYWRRNLRNFSRHYQKPFEIFQPMKETKRK